MYDSMGKKQMVPEASPGSEKFIKGSLFFKGKAVKETTWTY